MPRHFTVAAILCACLILPGEAGARPLHYTLDPATSEVRFAIDLTQGGDIRGRMPVAAAALTLDFEAAAQSRVQVTLDPAHARTNLPFATQAMKGPEVLDTGAHPQIRFESTRVRADGDGAIIDGQVTIRGVTRPITLAARIYRPKGSAEGARDQLTVHLTGTVRRSEFGATGFPDFVGDEVRLDILARIRQDG